MASRSGCPSESRGGGSRPSFERIFFTWSFFFEMGRILVKKGDKKLALP